MQDYFLRQQIHNFKGAGGPIFIMLWFVGQYQTLGPLELHALTFPEFPLHPRCKHKQKRAQSKVSLASSTQVGIIGNPIQQLVAVMSYRCSGPFAKE